MIKAMQQSELISANETRPMMRGVIESDDMESKVVEKRGRGGVF